jgi:hypothetical protein
MDKKSDLKIDFINFEEDFTESHSYPMGILYISAYLKENGFTNIGYVDHICLMRKIEETKTSPKGFLFESRESISERRKNNLEDLFKYLESRQPHMLLLGPVTTLHLVELEDLAKRIRKNLLTPLLFAGGPHFGRNLKLDEELLKCCPGIDGLVDGEGEETILDIAYHCWGFSEDKKSQLRTSFLKKNKEIKGLAIRGQLLKRRNPVRLENLPSPDMRLLEEYWNEPKTRAWYEYSLSKRRNPVTRNWRALVDDYSGDSD